jgi:hypothetical protein
MFFVFFTNAIKNIRFYKTLREHLKCGDIYIYIVIKTIGNNEERKGNHSTEIQDFNVENPL